MDSTRLRAFVTRHRLPMAVLFVIAIALIMTAISMSLYITSGTSSLDLSRPGYIQAREEVYEWVPESFDETGPLNQESVDEFKAIFESQRTALSGLTRYDNAALDDTSLQLNVPQ